MHWRDIESFHLQRNNKFVDFRKIFFFIFDFFGFVQVALANFVESAGGTLSAYLYCHYIHMLAGISSTQSSAHACFELLRFAKGNELHVSTNVLVF